MAQVELARRAQADLRRLQAWLAEKDVEAANRAANAIADRIKRLERFPELGPRMPGEPTRQLQVRFGKYGYVVRYVLAGDRVLVTRIFHGREDR